MLERFGAPLFWTDERIKPALIAARGSLADTARLLAKTYNRTCSRQAVGNAIQRSPELRQIQQTCLETVLDICESQVVRRAELGDQKDQHFLLMTKGKGRGYSKQTQVAGVGPGGSIPVIDLSKLTEAELSELEALIERAA